MPILRLLIVVVLGCWTYAHAKTPAPPTQEDATEVQRLRDQKSAVETEIETAQTEASALEDELMKRKEAIAEASKKLKELEAMIDAKNKELIRPQAPADH